MSEQVPGPDFRVVLITDDPGLEKIIRELFAASIPSVVIESAQASAAGTSDSAAAIIDESIRGSPGLAAAQELRARGYRGGIALLTSVIDNHLDRRLLALAPAVSVGRMEMVEKLPAALASLAAIIDPGDALAPVQRDLRRTQQLIASGEAAMRIQHSLNNPLAALLAEAQLLEMEPLSEENLAAVKRIVQLCRRMVGMVRAMDTAPVAGSR